MTRLLASLAAVLAALFLASGTGRATVAQRGPEDAESARAVAELTGPDRTAVAIPASFAAGDRPVVVGGKLLDPRGSCSSPVDLPASFDDACRAHDLGYDLLRHAAAQGGPLGPWARRAIDEQLARDLSAACETGPARCHVLAGVADLVVAVNSWRQGWSVPVVEHGPFVRGEP
ncbi:hypothetical protein EV188_101976 [Actinomycetospora succinea]|uniref:Phospholipase A2-like protein n=1 Tax=Actinomycetospora succinea TaxID=663603 RepID=A0A4R6VSX8_9PSEU|nr:hypothetical protein [Actinomycetospora succinea]TDQ65724.1 hypothetical protein EV188_101976 [Actinomycetospora succinea]